MQDKSRVIKCLHNVWGLMNHAIVGRVRLLSGKEKTTAHRRCQLCVPCGFLEARARLATAIWCVGVREWRRCVSAKSISFIWTCYLWVVACVHARIITKVWCSLMYYRYVCFDQFDAYLVAWYVNTPGDISWIGMYQSRVIWRAYNGGVSVPKGGIKIDQSNFCFTAAFLCWT